HGGAVGDPVGGQIRVDGQHRHRPPLGDRKPEPALVAPGNVLAHPVRQHAEPVGQEPVEFEPGMSGGGGGGWGVAGHVAGSLANSYTRNYKDGLPGGSRRDPRSSPMSAQPNLGMQVTTFENPMGI